MGWIGIAIGIAVEVLKEVGAKAQEKYTIEQLIAALKDAVSTIIAETKAALEKADLDQAEDLIQSADLNLRHYTTTGAEDRLVQATNDITLACARLDDIDIIDPIGPGLLGHPDFTIAAGLKSAVLQERIAKYGESERVVLRDHLISAIATANTMHTGWWDWNNRRFSTLQTLCVPTPAANFYYFWYFFEKKKTIVALCTGDTLTDASVQTAKKDAEAKRQAHIDSEWATVYKQFVQPSIEVVGSWQKLLAKTEAKLNPAQRRPEFTVFSKWWAGAYRIPIPTRR